MVTKTTASKIWDPYDILDISRVIMKKSLPRLWALIFLVIKRDADQETIPRFVEGLPSRQSGD